MPSRVAADVARARQARLAAMTPAERVKLAERLSEEGVASFMVTHRVDRPTAIARIKATRRVGRRASSCADEH